MSLQPPGCRLYYISHFHCCLPLFERRGSNKRTGRFFPQLGGVVKNARRGAVTRRRKYVEAGGGRPFVVYVCVSVCVYVHLTFDWKSESIVARTVQKKFSWRSDAVFAPFWCMCVLLTSYILPPPSRQPRAQLQLDERDLKNSFLCRVFWRVQCDFGFRGDSCKLCSVRRKKNCASSVLCCESRGADLGTVYF